MATGINTSKNKPLKMANNLMNRVFCILTAFVIFSTTTNGQSKPKRDISKDRSTIVAQQKAEQRRKQEAALRQRQKTRTTKAKVASYLKVNQNSFLTETFGTNEYFKTFYVNTDGKEWSVENLPSWCNISKYPNHFVLTAEPNSSHDDRFAWIKVKSDNKEVQIDITQQGKPLNISAKFNSIRLGHNIEQAINNTDLIDQPQQKCLEIHTLVTIKGAKDQKCLIVASIYDERHRPIKASYRYSQYGWPVHTQKEVIPKSDNAETFNIKLTLPNDALKLPKKKSKLYCRLTAYCVKTKSNVYGANIIHHFNAKSKKDGVITKE